MRRFLAMSLAFIVLLSIAAILPAAEDSARHGRPAATPANAPPPATRATLMVGPGQTYTHIQTAIDAAAAGDTVRVYNSTYFEHIYLNRSITLQGNSSSGTVIDGNSVGSVVTVNANWCNVTGLKVIRSGTSSGASILIKSARNLIQECNVSNSYKGIKLNADTHNNTINRTIMRNNTIGAHFASSRYNQISNCTIQQIGVSGIQFDGRSVRNKVYKDTIVNCGSNGIVLMDQADNNTLDTNTLKDNDIGVFLNFALGIEFKANTFDHNGVAISGNKVEHWTSHNFIGSNNKVNGYLLFYIKNKSGTIMAPSDVGQIILANCSDLKIGGYKVQNATTGVLLGWCDGVRATNNNASCNSHGGIYLEDSKNCTIDNNLGYNESQYGISLYRSDNNTVRNNTATEGNDGVCLMDSRYNAVQNNTVSANMAGIYLLGSTKNIMSNNTITGSLVHGIHISTGSDSNVVANNTIIGSMDSGVMLMDADQNAVVWNEIIGNHLGVNVTGTSKDNQVHHNNLLRNNATGHQARDQPGDSSWDNGTVGNYWDDHVGIDSDYNGIFDDYHTIDSIYSIYDDYPLLPMWRCPKIRALSFNNPIEDHQYYVNFTTYTVNLPPEPLTWGLDTNASWLGLDPPSNLTGTAQNNDLGIYYVNISLQASNKKMDFFNFSISVVNTNDPPVITTSTLPGAMEDTLYSVPYFATDPDPTFDTVKWAVNSNASFLIIGQNSGILTGMPGNSNVGTFWVNVSATDDKDGTGYKNLTLTVANLNDPPTIDTSNVISCLEDALYSVQYNASDIDPTKDTFTWSLTSNGTFLTMTPSGQMSGTPDNSLVGPHWVNVSVNDGNGGLAWSNFTLTVLNTNDPPAITTTNIETCLEGLPYSVTYNATDPDPTNDLLLWKLDTNASFLTMNSALRVLFGLPDDEDIGNYWVNLTCSDGVAQDCTNFTLTVLNSNDAPEINDRPADISMDEDAEAPAIDLNGWFFDRDGDALVFYCLPSTNFTVGIAVGGLATITPKADWSGIEELTFIADDQLAQVSDTILITVFPVNDDPKDAQIGFAKTPYVQGKPQPANGSSSDADLEYGDALTFKWSSNVSGTIGTGKDIDLKLKAGDHTIILNVTDKAGKWCVASKELQVMAPQTNITPDDDVDDDITKDNDTDNDTLPDWWEKQHFSNLSYGPNDDPDGDGRSNYREYNDGTDPTQPDAKDEDGPSFVGSTMFYALLGAAVVILLIIIIAVIVLRKKPAEETDEEQKSSKQKSRPDDRAPRDQDSLPRPMTGSEPLPEPAPAIEGPSSDGAISKGLQGFLEEPSPSMPEPEPTMMPEPEPLPFGSPMDGPVPDGPTSVQGAPDEQPMTQGASQPGPKDQNEKAMDDLFNI